MRGIYYYTRRKRTFTFSTANSFVTQKKKIILDLLRGVLYIFSENEMTAI